MCNKSYKNVFSLSPDELIDYIKYQNFQKYRAEQILNWIWEKKVFSPEKMKNIPDKLKQLVNNGLFIPKIKKRNKSSDGTVLLEVTFKDNNSVETVIIKNNKKNTICISTGIGCPIKCKFCATGNMDYKRQLDTYEIYSQVLLASLYLKEDERINNIVFMGMGEPFIDYKVALKAASILTDKRTLGIGQRRITISTAGIVPGIRYMANIGKQFKLAVSLNASNDKIRKELMPIDKKWSIKSIIEAVKYYIEKTNRAVTFEYVLIKDVNDHHSYADELSKLLKGLICKVNLIPYNKTQPGFYKPEEDKIEKFQKILIRNRIETTIRVSKGQVINAACGQLFVRKGVK